VAAERAEEILEWMDRLHKGGNADVKPDTITFNAVSHGSLWFQQR
jgi:hypothetical protein